jgi:aminoglycoside phosphotransferase (APT) family kinase protein
MSTELAQKCRELVLELKLGTAKSVGAITPLTGGVSSDIAKIEVGDASYCAKFALAKLKVAADWQAPVHRNKAEYEWLKVAAEILPESALTLFGRSETLHGFAMEFLTGGNVYLWKTALLDGQDNRGEAATVGDMLGRIHAASVAEDFDTSPFQNRDDFHALRIEPYLLFTASRHPNLAKALTKIADELYASNQVLIHGDVSPKNILLRGQQPIILDAECATMGDSSFDVAFCLNHLLLKSLYLPQSRGWLLQSVLDFWNSYAAHINWETSDALEARICRLLPALMLARVDGKSPVEYLDAQQGEQVRQLAIPLIQSPLPSLAALTHFTSTQLKTEHS